MAAAPWRGVPTPMVSATSTRCTPMPFISPGVGHLLRRDGALVGQPTVQLMAAPRDAGGQRGLRPRARSARCSRRCEQLMFFWLNASLAAPNTTISSGGLPPPPRSPSFGRQHADKRTPGWRAMPAITSCVVGHLRHQG